MSFKSFLSKHTDPTGHFRIGGESFSEVGKATGYFKQAALLFNKHPHLTPFTQYYWQEKAALHRINQEIQQEQEALSELGKLKTVPGFEKEEYEKWLNSFIHVSHITRSEV